MAGNVQWSRHYLRSSAVDAQLYAGSMLPDNGGIMHVRLMAIIRAPTCCCQRYKLMKISPTGELLWVKEYDIAGGTDAIGVQNTQFSGRLFAEPAALCAASLRAKRYF
jgi:hypothetical protein